MIRTQGCVLVIEGGGGMGGRMGAAAAAVSHDGMHVPLSSQSIQSKYLYYLMEILYTKINDVCMYECINAY